MKLTVVFGAAEQCLRGFLYKIFVLRQNKMPMCHKDVPFRALREYAVSTIIFKGDSAHAFAAHCKKAVSVS